MLKNINVLAKFFILDYSSKYKYLKEIKTKHRQKRPITIQQKNRTEKYCLLSQIHSKKSAAIPVLQAMTL